MPAEPNVVHLDASQAELRRDFLRWQCRIRQQAVREADGRPQDGMRPYVHLPPDSEEPQARIVTVLNKRAPETVTAEFRHMMKRHQDPRERHDAALRKLAAEYFQDAEDFSDALTALFGARVPLVDELVNEGQCTLDFQHTNRRYVLTCTVTELAADDPEYQATYWHNSLFNPYMEPGVRVLRFAPHWATAQAEPGPY